MHNSEDKIPQPRDPGDRLLAAAESFSVSLAESTLPAAQGLKTALDGACVKRTSGLNALYSSAEQFNTEPNPDAVRNIDKTFSEECGAAVKAHKSGVMQCKGLDRVKTMLCNFIQKLFRYEVSKLKESPKIDSDLRAVEREVKNVSSTMKR